jgi:cytochrome c oxidase cbb3-type subunit III
VSAVEHGAALYARMCSVCHGANGEGYKADQATALAQPDFLASVSDEFLGVAIAEGRKGTTMSAWYSPRGGPLSETDINALISFLRSWSKRAPIALDERPVHGDSARGKAIFTSTCASCHGEKAPNVRILNPALLAHASDGYLRLAIRKGRPPTAMLGYEKSLADQGIEDVLAYLRSLLPPPRAAADSGRPPPIPLGPVPLNPKGPEPIGFRTYPETTPVAVVGPQLARKARMVLLDARVPSDYAQEHIAGAVSVPFYDPAPYFAALPKSAWLVCYCGCPHAESGMLAQKLMAAGFSHVTVLDEGLGEWITKQYPMHTGLEP